MKPDYKNWVPKGMIASFAAGAGVALVLFLIFGVCGAFVGGILRWFLAGIFGTAALVLIGFTISCVVWYRAFDYGGKRQLSRAIVEGMAKYVDLPEGGRGLDVGCGRGGTNGVCGVALRPNHYAPQFHPELDGAALGHRLGFYVGHGYFATEELERLRAWALTQDVSPSWAVLRNFVAVHAR